MTHIFISYSHNDSVYAHELSSALENAGFSIWIDDRIDYGAIWPLTIQEQVDTCSAFIVVMSPDAQKSQWVQNELARAQRKTKPIFPLLFKGDEPWVSTEATQYLDVRGNKMPPPLFFEKLATITSRKTPISIDEALEWVKDAINPINLGTAIEKEKNVLLQDLSTSIKHEIESLKAIDTLTINVKSASDGTVIRSIEAAPTIEYSRALWLYLRGKNKPGQDFDSYVTPFVCQRTNKVFVNFYTSKHIQDIIINDLKSQINRFIELISKIENLEGKKTIIDAINLIVEKDLHSIIQSIIMAQSFEESVLEILSKTFRNSIVSVAIGLAIIQGLGYAGVSISNLWLLPVGIAAIIIQAATFKEKLGNKVAKKLCDTVSIDLFPNINLNIATKISDEIKNEITSRLQKMVSDSSFS